MAEFSARTLVAVIARPEIHGGPVIPIPAPSAEDGAHGHLLAVLMLEEHACRRHLLLTHIVGPSDPPGPAAGVVCIVPLALSCRNRLGFRGLQLDSPRPFGHHLASPAADAVGCSSAMGAYCRRGSPALRAPGGQRHPSAGDAELRPDVPAQRGHQAVLDDEPLRALPPHAPYGANRWEPAIPTEAR